MVEGPVVLDKEDFGVGLEPFSECDAVKIPVKELERRHYEFFLADLMIKITFNWLFLFLMVYDCMDRRRGVLAMIKIDVGPRFCW